MSSARADDCLKYATALFGGAQIGRNAKFLRTLPNKNSQGQATLISAKSCSAGQIVFELPQQVRVSVARS